MGGGSGGGEGDEPFLGREETEDFLKYPSHLLVSGDGWLGLCSVKKFAGET